MNSRWFRAIIFVAAFWQIVANVKPTAAEEMGPLRIHPDNPRYFADGQGRAVWLTGSHTWANMHERGIEGETPDFDFDRYLDFLHRHGHNFIRLWAWEHAQWMQFVPKDVHVRYTPQAYQRTGPGQALDGKPKFDLTKFNSDYFQRLRSRVEKARARKIYVSVMFFQGFSLNKRRDNTKMGNAWHGHPYHRANNINGIDGNPSGDDTGYKVHELKVPAVTQLQEAFVRKVIDTVGDLDNVLWEIGNECHVQSIPWQYHVIQFVKQVESSHGKQHVVGMTGAPITAGSLYASPADWISPPKKKWLTDPPVNDGRKIVLVDNDHCDPWHHDPDWVWKAFFRGHHFILMDGYMDFRIDSPTEPDRKWQATRLAMGQARRLSEQFDLSKFVPRPDLASSGYCLASHAQYLTYLPKGGSVDMDLRKLNGSLTANWINPESGRRGSGSAIDGGRQRKLTSPLRGTAILLLSK